MFGHYVLTKSCKGKTTSGINLLHSKFSPGERDFLKTAAT